MRLGRIGFDNVVGYLRRRAREPGRPAGAASGEPSASVPRWRPNAAGAATVVDVRTPHEREEGAIAGSLVVPLTQLEQRLGEMPRDRPLIVHCAGGYRSSIAASVLKRDGFDDVSEMAGGMTAWQAAGLPVAGLVTYSPVFVGR